MSSHNPATSGKVTLDGQNVWENEEALKHICFARELNVNGNNTLAATKVKEYLRVASIYLPFWDQDMANRLIQKFNLDPKKKIGKLSKGMASMLTIVVALASKADFTFLDEPVSGLDVVAREQFYRLLVDEFTETGRTFVISSHIMEEAADLFEEVIMLKEGRILLKENTQELAVQKAMLYWNLGVVFVAWMIGVGMMGADQSYFCIGTMIALMEVCVISLVVGGMVIYVGFDDAVHMGKTRKRFLPAVSLVLFLFCLSGLVLTALLCKVEGAVYGMLYPNFEWEPGPEKYLGFRWLLGYASAITGLACVYSGIIKVNRKIGGAFCLVVWIVAC